MTSANSFVPAVDPDRAMQALAEVATSTDADAVDAFLLGRVGEYTRFADDRIHQPQDIVEVQLMVRAIVDGHAARASTSSLERLPEAARIATETARSLARAAGRPGRTTVATPSGAGSDSAAAVDLWDEGTAGFDAAARVVLVRLARQSAADQGGDAAGMIGRALTQQVVATSTGVRRSTLATEASGALTVSVADGTAHFIDLGRAVGRLELAAAIATTAEQARASVGRSELEPGEYQVVLGPEATAELLEFLPDFGFSGELAASGVGVCTRSVGVALAAPVVTVADDAVGGVGLPIGFDIEGVAKQRVSLLERGVVGAPVTDLATAALLGVGSTGHAHIAREEAPATRAANLVMSPGEHTEAELVAGVERGVYIQRFWYTRLVDRNASTITGVTRDACFEIVDGKLGRPAAGMRFTQSVLGLLAGVDAVGDRVRSVPLMNVWNGSASAPAVRARGFRLGAAPARANGDK